MPTIDVFIGSSSLLHTTAVSIERGIAVSWPLKHLKYMNIGTAKRSISVIWIYCVVILVLGLLRIPITSEQYGSIFFFIAVTLSFLIPCVLFVISYGFILVSAFRNIGKAKSTKRKALPTEDLLPKNVAKNVNLATTASSVRFREIKVTLNVAIMTIPFVCGWGYFMARNVYAVLTRSFITGFQGWLISFIPFIISCVNPLIYIAFTRSLRMHSKKMISAWYTSLKKCFCNRSSHVD
ncbi:dopamine receptor 1-like [Clytia hemisphaerica]|uniref:dopamine receptor 1-like n=1 Tax=Clytia hemisphaerica TaxID=252671 RepID=UPI0034D4F670